MIPCGSVGTDARVESSRKTPALTPGLLVCLFYLDFSFDEGGDVVLVLEDGEGLQQVVL